MQNDKVISLEAKRFEKQSIITKFIDVHQGLKNFNTILHSANEEKRILTNEEVNELSKIIDDALYKLKSISKEEKRRRLR